MKRRWQVLFCCAAGLVVILSLAGCYKKSGKAVVLEKEHIAIGEVTPTPKAESSSSPSELTPDSTEATPGANESAPGANASTPSEETVREMRQDEIDVDGYVMKKNVRGTSKDPRAVDHEQWMVLVKMITDLRQVRVQTDQTHWNKLKAGDRIKVSYRQGKYTGTIWASEID